MKLCTLLAMAVLLGLATMRPTSEVTRQSLAIPSIPRNPVCANVQKSPRGVLVSPRKPNPTATWCASSSPIKITFTLGMRVAEHTMLSFLSSMAFTISSRIASYGSNSEVGTGSSIGFAQLGSLRWPFHLYFWTAAGHDLTWGEAQAAIEVISDYMNESKVWATLDFWIMEGDKIIGRGQIS